MKKYILVVGVVIVALVAYFLIGQPVQDPTTQYSNSELGLEFQYRPGPTGYVVQEMTPSDPSGELLRSLVVIRSEDLNKSPEGSEGPATITIDIFKNVQNEQPGNWSRSHIQYSSINLVQGDVTETSVGGANAIRYMSDGLYASEKAVVAHGGNIYLFSGAFIDQDSDLRRDFAPLLQSVRFIERPGDNASTAKIDINAVCDGALAYMTFANDAEAQVFVTECKEGKRPEVIEQYKDSLNLDGATI